MPPPTLHSDPAGLRDAKRSQPPSPPAATTPLPSPAATPLPKPLLASEALMEDLAPVEPGRGPARLWCAGAGFAYAMVGCAFLRPGEYTAAVPVWILAA